MHFSGDRWRVSSSDNTTPAYYHWDSDEFGSFYKVDGRVTIIPMPIYLHLNSAHMDTLCPRQRKHLKELVSCLLTGFLFDDLTISESDKSLVDAYTDIESPEKFYDKAKAYLTDNYEGEGTTIVSRAGNEIDLGSYNLVIDSSASSAFAFDGTTITIKASTFVGNLTTSLE